MSHNSFNLPSALENVLPNGNPSSLFLRFSNDNGDGHAAGWRKISRQDYTTAGRSTPGVLLKQFQINVSTETSGEVAPRWFQYVVDGDFQAIDFDTNHAVKTVRYQDVCYKKLKQQQGVQQVSEMENGCVSHLDGSIASLFFSQDPKLDHAVKSFLTGLENMQQIGTDDEAISIETVAPSANHQGFAGLDGSYTSLTIFSTPFDVFAPAPTFSTQSEIIPSSPSASSASILNKSFARQDTSPTHTIRWLGYAVRALGTRFWILTKNADSADIFVVLLGYLLMHLTFVRLFLNMRKMGSSFWLPSATLISSTFGFLFALFSAFLLEVPVDPITLSEALPFLVITIGFDKPFLLARAVFGNPEITPVQAQEQAPLPELDDYTSGYNTISRQTANGGPNGGPLELDLNAIDQGLAEHARIQREIAEAKNRKVRWSAPKPAKTIVLDAVSRVGPGIVRDYAIEIAVLCLGAASGIGGLKEFCQLAALILAMDCFCLFTFYVAILSVMVEVHRIKLVRRNQPTKTKESNGSASYLISPASAQSSVQNFPTGDMSMKGKTFWKTVNSYKEALVGVKGADVADQGDIATQQSPALRLKLALIVAFLALHLLNLCTTLTEQTALKRHHDIPVPSQDSGFDMGTITPALQIVGASLVEVLAPSYVTARLYRTSKMASLDHFMSEWTLLVGDPVLSKWIVVAMFVSILLNGYLIKGIASVSVADGASGPGAVAAAAARLVGNGWDSHPMRRESMKRRWSGGIQLERWSANRQTLGEDSDEMNTRGKVESLRRQSGLGFVGTLKPVQEIPSTIPVHLPHPAPHARHHRSGDSTPRSEDLAASKPTKDGEMGHIHIMHTPTVPIISTSEISLVSATSSDGNLVGIAGRRQVDECWEIYNNGLGALDLSDEEVILLVEKGKIPGYSLERGLKDLERAVRVRRAVISRASITRTLENSELPMAHYDYSRIIGACCENVVGYMPIPVGIAGPLIIDGEPVPLPMATTEGTLVASTSRGCKALNSGGGVTTVLLADAMTRGPAIDFPNITMAAEAKHWIDGDGFPILKEAFESTSRFAKLQKLKCALAGRTLYVRFATKTGDAMGMNMISKGTEKALAVLGDKFPQMIVLALSGNYW